MQLGHFRRESMCACLRVLMGVISSALHHHRVIIYIFHFSFWNEISCECFINGVFRMAPAACVCVCVLQASLGPSLLVRTGLNYDFWASAKKQKMLFLLWTRVYSNMLLQPSVISGLTRKNNALKDSFRNTYIHELHVSLGSRRLI